MRGGVDRVVIVVGQKDGDRIREAVSRTRAVATGKVTIEFLEDTGEPSRQFHAKSILRARCVVVECAAVRSSLVLLLLVLALFLW